MTETRFKSSIYLIGEMQANLGGRVLPTSLEVLKVYFHRHTKENMSKKDAVKFVVQEICDIWDKARVPTSEERSIVRKLNGLLERYRNICRSKNRTGPAQVANEAEFLRFSSLLFDISHHNALNMIKIDEDKQFLNDQRSGRKFIIGGVDRKLAEKEQRKEIRSGIEARKREKEALRKRKAAESASGELEEMFRNEDDQSADDNLTDKRFPSRKTSRKALENKSKVRALDVVPKELASALDRSNISDRKATYLLTAAAQTYGNKDVSKLPLSASSIRRSRIEHRSQHAANTKATFSYNGPLVCHFDGKLLPAISGGAEKEERLAVLVSGHDMEKLLGVPKVSQGNGEQVAKKVLETLTDWNVQNQIVGMSFDTTSANTGRLNGACVLLEKMLDKQLLWLACRHHVMEVLCGDVFKTLFGATSGPDVLLFKRFQKHWPNFDQSLYQSCTDERLNGELHALKIETITFMFDVLKGKVGKIPREDYRELMELVLLFLGEIPPRGVHFRVPGAFHHARWMSKLLYVFKICMFSSQFKLTKHEKGSCLEFALFAALIYVKAWITCMNSCDAPVNDLNLIVKITDYSLVSKVVSKTAIKAMY